MSSSLSLYCWPSGVVLWARGIRPWGPCDDMKTRGIILALLAILTGACSRMGKAAFSVRAVDEGGKPVPEATVNIDFYRSPGLGEGAGLVMDRSAEFRTDTNGVATVEGRCNGSVGWNVEKAGFYRTIGPDTILSPAGVNRWAAEKEMYEVELRAIGNPIPMYARHMRHMLIPEHNTALGFDLVKGAWLPPHGAGEVADFVVSLNCEFGGTRRDGNLLFEAKLSLSFSNEGDGIQEIEREPLRGSVFRLPRFAPEDGYTPVWTSETYARETKDYCVFKENQNFIFRVRTLKDEQGNIISAQYGKIAGPIFYEVRESGATMKFTYYLNPTPNDRNLEFDPSRNLFTDLSSVEEVQYP